MAEISWDVDASGDWSTPSNWTGDAVPSSTDTVAIATSTPQTITYSTGTDAVVSLAVADDAFAVSGGSLTVTQAAVFAGALSLLNGTLTLGNGSRVAGAFAETGGALGVGQNDTLTLAGASTLGGDIDGGGVVSNTGTAVLNQVNLTGDGTTLRNDGLMTGQNNVALHFSTGATTLDNAADGKLDLLGGFGFYPGAANSVLTNEGTLSSSGTATNTIDPTFVSTGTVDVTQGVLSIQGVATLGGTVTGAGELLIAQFGTLVAPHDQTISVAMLVATNLIDTAGHTLTLAGASTLGGDIDGGGVVSNTGTAVLNQVNLTGDGTTLRNDGLMTGQNNVALHFSTGATTLDNAADGKLDLLGGFGFYPGAANSVLTNEGTLSSSGTATNTIDPTFVSTGTVDVTQGVLSIQGVATLGGTVTGAGELLIAQFGTLVAPHDQTISVAMLVATNLIDTAGHTLTLAGASTLGGDIDGGGVVSNTGTAVLNQVNLTGDGTTLRNDGLMTGQNNVALHFSTGATTLDNAADGKLDLLGGFGFYPGAANSVLTNEGTLSSSGTATNTIDPTFVSTGTVDVTQGVLSIQGVATLGGTVTGAGELLIAQFGTLVAPHDQTISVAMLVATNLIDTAGHTLTLAGASTLGGDIDGGGVVSNTGTAVLNQVNLTGDGTTLRNDGLMTGQNNVALHFSTGATTLDNAADGKLDLLGGFGFYPGAANSVLTNEGTLSSSGTATNTIDPTFVSTGTVDVTQGVLSIQGVATLGGTVTGAGELLIAQFGTLVAPHDQTISVAMLVATNLIDTAGHTLTLAGASTLGGDIDGGGVVSNTGTAVLNQVNLTGDGTTLRNDGLMTGQNNVALHFSTGATTLDNAADGKLDLLGGFGFYPGAANSVLTNEGTLSSSGTATNTIDPTFVSTGTVDVTQGVLSIQGVATLGGTVTGAGELLIAQFGTLVAPHDQTISVAMLVATNLIDTAGHTLTLAGASTLGGDIDGGGVVSNTGTAVLNQVNLTGDGTTLRNDGLMTGQNNVALHFSTGATTLDNAADGKLDLLGGFGFYPGAANSVLTNEGTLSSSGTATNTIDPTFVSTGTVDVTQGVLSIASGIAGAGHVLIGAAGELVLGGSTAAGSFVFDGRGGDLLIDTASSFGTGVGTASYAGPEIGNFEAGDKIDLAGLGYNAATMSDSYTVSSGLLQISNGSADATLFFGDDNSTVDDPFHLSADGTGGTLVTNDVACFARGTRILTVRGEIPVEALTVGDLVVTLLDHATVLKPVRWLGHRRLVPSRHADPSAANPVRIAAGALADGVPLRDLLVSPGHRFALDGALVAAIDLVNDASITQEAVDAVEYWHVELDRHDVLLAEGAAAESYHDIGNRDGFAGGVMRLVPALDQRGPAPPCLPYGQLGATAAQRLVARAEAIGWQRSTDPAPWLEVDGATVQPHQSGDLYRFAVPAGAASIRLRSRTTRPSGVVPDSTDTRRLGLSVRGITLDGARQVRTLPLADARLAAGWHAPEDGDGAAWRWTDGDAALPTAFCASGGMLEVAINPGLACWVRGAADRRHTA